MEKPVGLEFRSSRWLALMWLGFAGVWIAAGFLTMSDEVWEPVIAFAFATVSAFVGSTNILRPAIVRLDDDGIDFRHWRIAWFVAWADITDVRFYTLRINGIKTHTNVIVVERSGVERRISSGLTISQRKLADLILLRSIF